MLTKVKHITRQVLRAEPNTLFVFGDNMVRKGLRGQAREMRGEPNAVGIPTKRYPGMLYKHFFDDSERCYLDAEDRITIAYRLLAKHAQQGGKIVWPEDGIGTGLAELSTRAPRIWRLIESYREDLDAITANRED